jgi:hypothetical protein
LLPRSTLPLLLLASGLCAAAFFGCASGDQGPPRATSTSGGFAGGGGEATTSAGPVSSASSGGEGGGPSVCGDGIAAIDEDCDGDDFAGKTCADYGYAGGELLCNATCHIVGKDCAPLEICSDDEDNDADGAVDCDDPDCASAAPCVDPCSAAEIVSLDNGFELPSMIGNSSALTSSCAAAGSRVSVLQVFVTGEGDLKITGSTAGDAAVAVRTECVAADSEIACENAAPAGSEKLRLFHVLPGQVYWIVLHGGAGDPHVSLSLIDWEEVCDDFIDGNYDGSFDCGDSYCQIKPACVPGPEEVGSPCAHHGDCASSSNDPLCLPPTFDFPEGSCSEFCDLALDDCPDQAACVDLGFVVHGACLPTCQTSDDCRAGYVCADAGAPALVCVGQ